MRFSSWLGKRTSTRPQRGDGFRIRPTAARYRPHVEAPENRTLPSTFNAATVSDLIADINAANAAGGTGHDR